MAKQKKLGSSVSLSLFIMLLKSFITQAFLSFICCLLCRKKKQQGNAGEFLIGLTEDVATFLHCLFTVIRLLIFPVIFLLTKHKGLHRYRNRKCGAQV